MLTETLTGGVRWQTARAWPSSRGWPTGPGCREAGGGAAGEPVGGVPAPEDPQRRRPVEDVAAGTRRIYRLNPVALAALRDQLDTYWQRALAGYADAIQAPTEEDR